MSDKEFTKETNLNSALQGKTLRNLKEILRLYDKDRLIEYYNVITKYDVSGSKQSIVNQIYDTLTDEEVINAFLMNLNDDEYLELIRVIEDNGELLDDYIKYSSFCYLRQFGIVHTFNYNNHLHVIIPTEIMSIIEKLDISKYREKVIENTKIINLAFSMLNLYGAVPLSLFEKSCYKYFNYAKNEKINLRCIFDAERQNNVNIVETENDIYLVKDEYLEDYNRATLFNVISKIEDDLFEFDFKEITLNDLLKYKDLFYYEETSSTIEFKKYLKKYDITDENIELLIGVIVETFRQGYEDGILFLNEMFEEEGININEKNIDEIMEYVNDIVNNISVWGNKGWTNKEIILGKCYE